MSKEKFPTFETNIKKLAGYVLIEKFNKVRFSTSFLPADKLPDNLKEFRDKLKSSLGQDKFESIYEYEFDIRLKGFKTCEEGALDRKLPILHEAEDVIDFFQKLKFVVNYPSRREVNDLLEKEIKDKLRNLDGKAFNSLYQEDMHNWMADRVGTFYTPEKANTLFQEINNHLYSWTMDGVTKSYFANIPEKYKFNEYNTLTKFLTNNKQVLHLVSQDLVLGRTRIVQTFQELQKTDSEDMRDYIRGFGHIFVYLKQLLDKRFCSKTLELFKSDKKGNLIVIECDTTQEIPELYNKLSDIINNPNKKIILITLEGDALANKFTTNPKYKSEVDKTSFNDLTKDSQKKLLEEAVITFQEQKEKTNLAKLIGIDDDNLNNYLSQEENQEQLNKIINSKTLANLIKGEEIKIGSKLKDLGEINDYYIDRRLNRQIEIQLKIKEDKAEEKFSDMLVISDNEEEFDALCQQQSKNNNIHWLKSESGKLFWQKSQGSISDLAKYREKDNVYRTDDKASTKGLTEKEYLLEENKSKFAIISDKAGMGKSTILSSLSVQIKKDNPNLWVIRIDLSDYTGVLNEELKNRKSNKPSFSNQNVDAVVNFLLNTLLESQEQSKLTTLEKELFKSSVNGQGKITLLFDGFDEISPDYEKVVIDILQALKESKVKQVFVTTRPNMRYLLEEKLEVFSHVLEPFSYPNQIEFFTKFWTKKLELKDLNEERLKTYAKSLIKKFSTSINDRGEKFISVPLQTMMLAEVFQEKKEEALEGWGEWEGCQEFLTADRTHQTPKLPEKLDLLSLYEGFVERKFDEFHLKGKKNRDFTKPGEKESAKENYENFHKRQETLALDALFNEEDLKKILSDPEIQQLNNLKKGIKNAQYNEGIVDKIIDNKPHFIHRTFAEYFASFSIPKLVSKKTVKQYLWGVQSL